MQAQAAIFEQELTSKICYSDNIPDKKIKIKQLLFVKVKKKIQKIQKIQKIKIVKNNPFYQEQKNILPYNIFYHTKIY